MAASANLQPHNTLPAPLCRVPISQAAAVCAASLFSAPSEALEALVVMALEAGATEVAAEVDLGSWGLRLQDNGAGLSAAAIHVLVQQLQLGSVATEASLGASAVTVSMPGAAHNRPAWSHKHGGGQVLLAACAAAEQVEIVSRAQGSFETDSVLVHQGHLAHQGLAKEQRCRQGTVIHLRGLFYNQPVRRKAVLSVGYVYSYRRTSGLHWQGREGFCRFSVAKCRLQAQTEQCRQAVLRLALLQPAVAFTCYDRSCKHFLLRLPKVVCCQFVCCLNGH
jgi:hypothetical protein